MEMRSGDTPVSPTEDTIPIENERALAPPRFDEKSVQRAQPAVPLTRREKVRSWPWKVAVLCVAAGLAGGVIGGLALTSLQRRAPRAESSPSTQARVESAPAAPAGQQQQDAATKAQEPSPQTPQGGDAGGVVPASGEVASETAAAGGDAEGASDREADAGTQEELRGALGEWVAATNARDVGRQMDFYAPTVGAFYLSRNASRESVRAEKTRVFSRASSVAVEASAPDIKLSRDGRTAVMRFRKRYRIGGEGGERSGEVLQELRWRRTGSGWKIVSERDLRVLH